MNKKKFASERYKKRVQQQWQNVAEGWHTWIPVISRWSHAITDQMLDLAGIGPGSRVLDIATGDGDQSMKAAQRVGPRGYVLATDISSDLLDFAAASAHEAGLHNLETRVMDGEDLELDDASFDAVICRLGLMLMPNVDQAMSEIYRVLKPGGRSAAVVFSSPVKNPWLSIPVLIARRHAQLPPPQPGEPGLFSLGLPGMLESVFLDAGFQDIYAQKSSAPFHLSSASECARLLKDIGGAIHTMLAPLGAEKQREAWAEIERGLQRLQGSHGFVSPCEVIVAAGSK